MMQAVRMSFKGNRLFLCFYLHTVELLDGSDESTDIGLAQLTAQSLALRKHAQASQAVLRDHIVRIVLKVDNILTIHFKLIEERQQVQRPLSVTKVAGQILLEPVACCYEHNVGGVAVGNDCLQPLVAEVGCLQLLVLADRLTAYRSSHRQHNG